MIILLERVREHIINCMFSFTNDYRNKELMHERLDELFLLWSHIENIPFVESVEEFKINYNDFNNKDYEVITTQIIKNNPEGFP